MFRNLLAIAVIAVSIGILSGCKSESSSDMSTEDFKKKAKDTSDVPKGYIDAMKGGGGAPGPVAPPSNTPAQNK